MSGGGKRTLCHFQSATATVISLINNDSVSALMPLIIFCIFVIVAKQILQIISGCVMYNHNVGKLAAYRQRCNVDRIGSGKVSSDVVFDTLAPLH